ncbi:hypothetical protein NM688_g8887 [Phlebia brevispora]|uniref:Uncharacterized protein n=1 Tax=Phlebia brevispora TaxID=194682 RepID=A0ACC1RR87_9APHY|nr:hypothetical protein NM688_g8887 [Phlebia brevispora]
MGESKCSIDLVNTGLKMWCTLGIQVPVVCAPMATGSTAKLVTQVVLGGGFAFIPAGYENVRHLREELATTRSILSSSGQSHSLRLAVGVGFYGWKLDQDGDGANAMLDAALQAGVRAIWFSFGSELGKYVEYVRESDTNTGRKTLIFIQVNSVDEALKAVNEWHADIVVAQGIEAGGPGANYAPPAFNLVSSILSALPPNAPPVLAAGGIINGAQIAGFLALGAAGAVLGTRFLLTPESAYTGPQKAALLISDSTSTVRSHAFAHARGTFGWPGNIDARGIRNKLVEDIENDEELSVVQERLADATKHGMSDYMVIYAGTGAADLHDIVEAQDVVKELYREIIARLRATQSILIEPKKVVIEPED